MRANELNLIGLQDGYVYIASVYLAHAVDIYASVLLCCWC